MRKASFQCECHFSEDDYFGVALNLFVSVVASDREVKDEHYI